MTAQILYQHFLSFGISPLQAESALAYLLRKNTSFYNHQFSSTLVHTFLDSTCLPLILNLTQLPLKEFLLRCLHWLEEDIEHLDLRGCSNVSDEDLDFISSHFFALKRICVMKSSQLTDQGVASLADIGEPLKHVSLFHCPNIRGRSLPKLFQETPYLRSLSLINCPQIDQRYISYLAMMCPNLEYLHLGENFQIEAELFRTFKGAFPKLFELHLSGCKMLRSKEVADFVETCRSLRCLNLSHCAQFGSSFLNRLAAYAYPLRYLGWEGNDGSSQAMQKVLESTVELQEVYFSSFKNFSDSCLKALSLSTSSLRIVGLANQQRVSPKAWNDFFSSCKQLEHVWLSLSSGLTEQALSALGQHPLKTLHINFCPAVDDMMLKKLSVLPTLEDFNCALCDPIEDDTILYLLGKGSALKFLNVSFSKVKDQTIKELIALHPDLHTLQLEACKELNGEFLNDLGSIHVLNLASNPQIKNFPHTSNLRSLVFDGSEVTTSGFGSFKGVKNLQLSYCKELQNTHLEGLQAMETLHLSHANKVTEDSIASILKKSPQLSELKLSYCSNINPSVLENIAIDCPHLHTLFLDGLYLSDSILSAISVLELKRCNLSYVNNLSEKGLCDFFRTQTQLYFLSLESTESVTDNVLKSIAQHCRSLRYLYLNHVYPITDQGVYALSTTEQNLKDLSLQALGDVKDSTLATLLRKQKHLLNCDLSESENVGEQTFVALQACTALESLNVSYSYKIPAQAIRDLLSKTKNLRYLFLKDLVLTPTTFQTSVAEHLVQLDIGACRGLNPKSLLDIVYRHPKLRVVNLDLYPLNENSLKELAENCEHLDQLSIAGCVTVKGKYLPLLSQKLNSLNLMGCSSLDERYFIQALKEGEELKELNLTECVWLTSDGLRTLKQKVASLYRLLLMGCDGISSEAFCYFFSEVTKLEELNLSYCTSVDNLVFTQICETSQSLKKLSLANCYSLSSLEPISLLRNLECLILPSCYSLSKETLFSLEKLSKLRYLSIGNNPQLTQAELHDFLPRLNQVEVLSLAYSKTIDANILNYLPPSLQVLYVENMPKLCAKTLMAFMEKNSSIQVIYE